ncbi:MAG TPA: oxygenase MpaB family protein [Acidimicrobiales bacterium]|nr:oxygenase MpaB family protein [Acidimicrobiales bacterium]
MSHTRLPTERREIGPGSLLWRWAGDNRIAFLGGTIGLLQLMQPAIGAGVLDHSDFFGDPYGRVFRSLPRILGTVYDGPQAEDTGREVRAFHKDIAGLDSGGQRYHALDPATFWWAHATFQFMTEQVGDRFDTHRITEPEREVLYLDGVEWYRRYGVSDRAVPATRAEFQVAFDDVCANVLEMNPAVEFVLDLLDHIEPPRLTGPLAPLSPVLGLPPWRQLTTVPLRIAAIGGLPAIVRERFDIPWSKADQMQLDAMQLLIAQAWRFVPFPMRWQPRAQDGWRRVWAERRADRRAA